MNDQMQIESREVHVNMRAGHWRFFFFEKRMSLRARRDTVPAKP